MSDTVDAVEIGGTWTDLNTLTGIETGKSIIVQNLGDVSGAIETRGTPNAVIEITIKDSAPEAAFVGSYIERNQQWTVGVDSLTVWVRFSRRSGAAIGSSLALVKVQAADGAVISSTGGGGAVSSVASVEVDDNQQQLHNNNVLHKLNSIIFLLEEIAGLSGLTQE